ncbi:MAG: AAA family ATPase [Thermodesulfobacteriota bacterium]
MHLEFYGFSGKPFELSPDLAFLYLNKSYLRAMETILRGIYEKNGVMVLIGEVGTGKTMLIHGVMARLNQNVKKAFIFHSTYDFKDLIQQILFELGEPTAYEAIQALKKPFLNYLEAMRKRGELLAVLIDEAHLLPRGVFEDLFHLIELNPWTSEILQLVLVGQPELEQRYINAFYKYRLQNPPLGVKIKTLSADESVDYIEYRLRIVGRTSAEIFTPKAISLIVEKAEGIPRVINNICDNALFAGYNASVKIINEDIIQKAVSYLEGPDYQPPIAAKHSWNVAFRNIFRKKYQYPLDPLPIQ